MQDVLRAGTDFELDTVKRIVRLTEAGMWRVLRMISTPPLRGTPLMITVSGFFTARYTLGHVIARDGAHVSERALTPPVVQPLQRSIQKKVV